MIKVLRGRFSGPAPFFVDVLPRWLTVAEVERLSVALAAAAAVMLRIVAVFRYRIDSDETQHLHVVWGWNHGLLQYRALFDNHMPLFHILFAPLLRMVGERPDALIAMRIAMLPLYAATIALTYRVASSCYPRRAAIWSTVVASLIPGYLLWSTEFRTDDLWTLFWLAAIAILVSARPTTLRIAAAGLALGLAAAVSAKTTLLLVALMIGAIAARQARVRPIAIFLVAFTIPPAAIALYFASRGALHPFFYGAISHNIAGHVHTGRLILFPFLLILIGAIARHVADSPQRMFLFVTTHFYAAALFCVWPLVEHEHWLPYLPLAAVTLVPLLRIRQVMAIVLVEVLLVIGAGQLWRDQTREGLAVIEQTLRLTRPGETVMDLKGETVFRNRAFFYVLEPLTKRRIRAGKIRDTIVNDMLRTKTMLVVQDQYSFPRATRKFLARNFVSVGAVRVAGKILKANSFQIEVPGSYGLIADVGTFTGTLDGIPYVHPRYLDAGIHSISPAQQGGAYAALWSRAVEGGLTPFGISQTHRHKLSPHRYVTGESRRCHAQGDDVRSNSHRGSRQRRD